jgi:TetR/AcrR family transcriptional regulator
VPIKDSHTEQQIKDAAKHLFFTEGRFKATTQEIADAAGVNRTLVNYYFRSRDLLFDQILKEARERMDSRMNAKVDNAVNFRERIAALIDVFMEQALTYPYLDIYIISRLNDDVEKQNEILTDIKKTDKVKAFLKEVEHEMKQGTIPQMAPVQFVMNLFSLLTYPVVVQPLFKKVFHYSDKQYRQLLADRKEIILKTLFN